MHNKNGWGIVEAIIFIIIFIICLLFSFWGLRRLGLVDENLQFYPLDKKNEAKEEKKEEKEEKKFSYQDLETKMTQATKKYISDFYDNELGLDTLNIRVSQLIDNGYLKELKDDKKKNCSGYVSVYVLNDETIYEPYLKCKKYETKGYQERKDD